MELSSRFHNGLFFLIAGYFTIGLRWYKSSEGRLF